MELMKNENPEETLVITHNIEFYGDVGPLFEALAKAQAAMGPVVKDHKNEQFKSAKNPDGYAHAHIDGILAVAIPVLSSFGLYFGQHPTRTESGDALVITVVGGKNGARMISSSSSPLARTRGPQDLGSAFTYLKRYAAQGVLGLSCESDDDDGNAAQRQHNEDTKQATNEKARRLEAVKQRAKKPTPPPIPQPTNSTLPPEFEAVEVQREPDPVPVATHPLLREMEEAGTTLDGPRLNSLIGLANDLPVGELRKEVGAMYRWASKRIREANNAS